jgi:hypothetical protein
MSRLAPLVAALVSLTNAACASSSPAPPPPPPPAPPCTVETGPVVEVAVNKQAVVSRPCIEVQNGRTDIVWRGDADVQYLWITYKPGSEGKIPPPICAGTVCILEKAKHLAKAGAYEYNVEVELKNGKRAKVDPMLIIKP